jgi:THO complex subunit 2
VRELGSSRILDVTQMKKTLELNLLVDSGLWADKPGLDKRLVKINTSLVYRQQKYNLLREESEGYSKLLTVLAALPSPPSDPASHITNVFALIGYFDLDPNRVLDMVLEVMEHQLWNASFLVLLKKFRRSSIAHILGFKFVHYHEDSNNSSEGQKSPRESSSEPDTAPTLPACATPKSLFLLAATLLTADLLDLDTLLPYLAPNLEDTGKLMVKERNRLKSEIKSFGVVNLSAKASTQSNKEKEKSDNTAVATASGDFAGRNQIIGVVAALILVKNWPLANEMMQLLQGVAIVDVVDFPDVAAAIISLVSWSINEVYKPVGFLSLSLAAPSPSKDDSKNSLPLVPLLTRSNAEDDCGDMDVDDEKEVEAIKRTVNKQFEAVSSLDFIVAELKPMLISLGHHLSDCPDLYSRICRVLKVRMESLRAAHAAVADASEINEASLLEDPELKDILLIISETLLPALTKLECNPALAALLWGMLSLLPFQVRFDIYRVWKGDGFGKQVRYCLVYNTLLTQF